MNLSPNQRIFFNILITYGRSIFILIFGLFTSRWVLMALGEVNYGLSGLVGGLVGFIGFINSLLAGAVCRFIAFSVGEEQKDPVQGLEKCRQWYNTALLIHTALPIIMVLIGYPLGEYAIRHWLTIPLDRIEPCVWVWRLVCISCFVGMVMVPFNALYYAKQYFAEITIYSTINVVINAIILYYMATHPGDWLIGTALVQCLLEIIPAIIIAIRSQFIFPECKLNIHYLWSWQRTKKLLNYSWWTLFGLLGLISKNQGIAILVNKYFGPQVNAAVSVANKVSGKSSQFSTGLIGAFHPAIANACGAGDFKRMQRLAFMTCKFGTMLILIIALPLALELPEIMRIWLKNPPQYSVGLCLCILTTLIIDQTAVGHMSTINANGKIAFYQVCAGGALFLTFPLAWLFLHRGAGVYAVGLAMIITMIICVSIRIIFAHFLVKMPILYWLCYILIPLLILTGLTLGIGYLPHLFMQKGLSRILVTGIFAEITFLSVAWLLVLNREEKDFCVEKLKRLWRR